LFELKIEDLNKDHEFKLNEKDLENKKLIE